MELCKTLCINTIDNIVFVVYNRDINIKRKDNMNELSNVDVNLKRATEALNNGDKEYCAGLINDSIDELQNIKKKLGY